ncbi:MAG: pentapeptide repeat-containing protein [Bacilli bacterium]|nr:pentapeptide repeat-containing protein [Bacilli bacterium]MDE6142387.1 pentapeptide repeat-containing protein [Bacilli bacterium]
MNKKFIEPAILSDAYDVDTSNDFNRYVNVTFDKELNNVSFDNCVFEECTFLGGMDKCTFYNCRFYKCEFSNLKVVSASLHSVLFDQCHMIGIDFIDCFIKYTEYKENNMRYGMFSSTKLLNTTLNNNNMQNGTFASIEFKDIEFINNDFSGIEVMDTPMMGINIASNKIDGIKISPSLVRGMIVTEVQAIELISILGVILDE